MSEIRTLLLRFQSPYVSENWRHKARISDIWISDVYCNYNEIMHLDLKLNTLKELKAVAKCENLEVELNTYVADLEINKTGFRPVSK